jgi:hypothetical protein
MATTLTMTATVKAMDSQRWVCRIHLFQFNVTSSEDEPEADRAHLRVLSPTAYSTAAGAVTMAAAIASL